MSDSIKFSPINANDTKLLLQLIDKRYEYKSTIITTNILLEKWIQYSKNHELLKNKY